MSTKTASSSLYEIPLRRIDGTPTTLAAFQGKVLLVVNVASKCGLTPQYEGLEKLYETYRDRGFEVLGFPANEFGAQEPGTNEEIQAFCTKNFGVEFPLFSKIHVKGADQHPLYAELTKATGEEVDWNFNKFLVDADGKVQRRFGGRVEPTSDALVGAIEGLLPG